MAFVFFYGYVILALCFMNTILMRGMMASFGVFYVALLEEFPWSHGTGATIASVNAFIYALSSPLVGWAFDRLGPRILMPVAAALMGIGLLLSGLSDFIWELYLYYGIVAGIGQAGLGFVSQSALISHWFRRRRGTAIGIATMGLGLGVLIMVPLAQVLIARLGWRWAFMVLSGLVLCTTVPANALLQRRSPEEMGQLPDGDKVPPAHDRGAPHERSPGGRQWTLRSALHSFPYWAITTGHLALGTGLSMLYTHLVAHLVHQGFDKLLSASIFGLMGLVRFGGTAMWGLVSDRLGRGRTYAIGTLVTAAGLAFLVAPGSGTRLWSAYAFAILFAVGHSAGNPTYGATIADIFGGSKVGTIFGFLEISFGLGMAFGPWFGGYVFDVTGSYRWAFALALISFVISYLAIQASLVWHRRDLAGPRPPDDFKPTGYSMPLTPSQR